MGMAMRTLLRHMFRFRLADWFVPLLTVAGLSLLGAFSLQAREPYRIGYVPGAMISLASKNRLAVVYERAGVPVEFVPLPQKRSLALAVEGSIDGDAGRILGLEERYPSMVRVNVKLLDFKGAAYVLRGRGIKQYHHEMLNTMRVGALSGVVWAGNLMQRGRLERVATYEALFDMLLEGRIDIALSSRLSAETVFSSNAGYYSRIIRLEPLAFKTSFYHYLNEKNADLAPTLEKALRELRAEDYWREGD
jgi:polar amino acid transport system substrate-binding protein